MAKIVYGKYDTSEEALQAVNALKYKGADGADITILADKANRIQFTNEEPNNDVDTEAAVGDSFMDKIASFFMVDSTERIEDRLIAKGIRGEEAEGLANEVENGKILILVDEGAAGMLQSETNGEMTNNAGLYASRNEVKMRHQEEKQETVGNMSRTDNLSVTDDDRLRDPNRNKNNDEMWRQGESEETVGNMSRVDDLSVKGDDRLRQKNMSDNDGALRNPRENKETIGDMSRSDDLSVAADDRLRDTTMNDRDDTLNRQGENQDTVGNMSRTDNLSASDNERLRHSDKNENHDNLWREGESEDSVGNMSRADNLSEKEHNPLRDSNLNERDDLDKKKTYPKNRIDTDNL